MKAIHALLLTLLALAPLPLLAADPANPKDAEVTIRPGDSGEVLHEYRINGQIIEIKVVPKIGKPYYLVPAEGGEGYIRLDRSQLLIPKWILFRW
ncbi:DUF2782 domain-containing protein [Motiliproteus sediminis]|uniref:DUF2782 domain-containing protein n=1 Tax=Motiliproteus sediminis TaxID=1468178 RepID=UPI001AF003AE|nr:DUF2782 domain-containing protein [Motiliproteus sediminis]